jgi:succinate dehydrogenase / fumarate reductase membrane anchor subunit
LGFLVDFGGVKFMTTQSETLEITQVDVSEGFEGLAWKWMRYSGLLLIPLAWGHVAIQDVLVGVHAIDLDYVAMRWASLGWRVYDFLLLAFAFAHGVNGLRQVLNDYVKKESVQRKIAWGLLGFWAILSLIGAAAIVGGVRVP